MLFPTSVILTGAALLGVVVEAQRPASVTVTSYSASKRCRGASSSKTVAPGNTCQSFARGANSYQVNRNSETCVLISYSDAACTTQLSRRELENSAGDPDEHCERLPQKAQSFKIRCGVDDHGGDDKMLLTRAPRHGQDDNQPDDHGHHRGGDGKMLLSRIARHGRDDNHPDDHGRHHGDDDHGHDDHGHDDHGHDDHGHDDHGHDDHGHDDHGHHHGGDGKLLLSRAPRHGHDDHGHDDHGRHHGHDDHGHDDHGRHHGHDDHGRHHGHDDHGRHHGGDDHGGDDHGGSGPGRV